MILQKHDFIGIIGFALLILGLFASILWGVTQFYAGLGLGMILWWGHLQYTARKEKVK